MSGKVVISACTLQLTTKSCPVLHIFCGVLCRIFAGGPAAGHTDRQLLQAHCVKAEPAGVGTTGAQSTACVYGYARTLACQRGKTDHRLLIDYYKTNIEYEKQSLTSLIIIITLSTVQ